MDLDFDVLNGYWQARWERYCQLSAAALILYEYLLQFSVEVELFWKKRWSLGKAIFLWSRVYSLGFNIGNASVFMQEHATYDLCNRFFHWQNTGASLQVVTTHIILEMRLYAMYRSSHYILALLVFLETCEVIAIGVIFGTTKPGQVGENNPFPGLRICADADPPHLHWIAFYWTAILSIEAILMGLAMYKAYENYKTGIGGPLMRSLSRESVLYFMGIFGIYLLNQILWWINRITLNELATGFSFAVSAVFANRLMISVRQHYYNSEMEEDRTQMTTLRFGRGQAGTMHTSGGSDGSATLAEGPVLVLSAAPKLQDNATAEAQDRPILIHDNEAGAEDHQAGAFHPFDPEPVKLSSVDFDERMGF
ncbi:hypothetical protein PUNSTDRAFT_145621 [Punctularia strigosozonata HHB-11173 SS5]|uniref:uncharacterized protein n=1 Tax=Punctularia strigosozonata (strain HHB-11173) TaxID=741275 RepID=UPI00044178B8|nr:uncharacterized protein PUNSTDRAFT_145621 [Punctularia strigosozonata HHB-11173 SS5]EIN05653.1 hypothetical protein PUNSTDRAFT_145621 [Punctularia strigosozonata HHB-11173 SS5]